MRPGCVRSWREREKNKTVGGFFSPLSPFVSPKLIIIWVSRTAVLAFKIAFQIASGIAFKIAFKVAFKIAVKLAFKIDSNIASIIALK